MGITSGSDSFRRASSEQCHCAQTLGVATLYEVLPAAVRDRQLVDAGIRPLRSGNCVAGPAVTAFDVPGQNLAAHVALTTVEPGDVLVLTSSSAHYAIIGELMGVDAQTRGAAGIVVEGAVRDVAALREAGPPVWCRAITPGHPGKEQLGFVNEPVILGGVRVAPGDLVVADDDGVLVIPLELVDEVLAAGKKRAEREAWILEEIRSGRGQLFELLGLEGKASGDHT